MPQRDNKLAISIDYSVELFSWLLILLILQLLIALAFFVEAILSVPIGGEEMSYGVAKGELMVPNSSS